HKTLGGGVDHPGPERFREPQRLDAVLAGAAQLDHREFSLDRASGQGHVDDAIDRDHAVELVFYLLDHHRRSSGDDGDAGDVLLALGLRDGETFDVVAAPGKQPDHARQHARFVLHQHRERVRFGRLMALFHEIGGCGLVHFISSSCTSSRYPHHSSYPRTRVSSKRRRLRENTSDAAYWIVRSSRTMTVLVVAPWRRSSHTN